MENTAHEAEKIIRREINLEQSSQKSKNKQSSIGAKKYAALFSKHHKPETDILLKPLQNISDAEINKAHKFAMFENNEPLLGKEIDTRIGEWYDMLYGNEPLQRDKSGRQIEPVAKIQLNNNHDILTKDGLSLDNGMQMIAERMAEIDEDDTPETGITTLQKSLNSLGAKPLLKVDGILGPKTVLQTR